MNSELFRTAGIHRENRHSRIITRPRWMRAATLSRVSSGHHLLRRCDRRRRDLFGPKRVPLFVLQWNSPLLPPPVWRDL